MELQDVQVVVLMGGLGSRLGEITSNQPKPLVPVAGKPFFEYQLKLLLGCGFRKFVFLVGYRSNMIEDYFGNGRRYGENVSISYSYDGEKLLGTGGAVVRALPLLEDEFLLIYGDSFMDVDYMEVLYRYREGKRSGRGGLMTVLRNEGRFDASNVRMSGGDIVSYKKGIHSPEYNYIDYGIEVFQREIFTGLSMDAQIALSDIQERLVDERKMSVCVVHRRFYEIGSPASLEEYTRYATDRFYTQHRAVFLDRDGVINEICCNDDTGKLDSPLHKDELSLLPHVPEAIRLLNEAGYYVFVVTNQPAAAKGKTTLGNLYEMNHRIKRQLQDNGCRIDEIAMCPHHPKGSEKAEDKTLIRKCDCRKPGTGLIDGILKKYAIDIEASWMIGDSYTDIQAGRKAALHTAFIGDYKCDVCARLRYDKPDVIAADLYNAVNQILSQGGFKMSQQEFIARYLEQTIQIAEQIDRQEIAKAVDILSELKKDGGRLFILGVGGSAANASHAVNDFRKIGGIETYAPTDNVSELTARTNDEGWDTTFVEWLRISKISEKDAVMVLSVGGGSETTSLNIVNGVKLAKERGAKVIAIVSRDGGYSKKAADAGILVPVIEESLITPHAEGWQGVIWHLMVNALD